MVAPKEITIEEWKNRMWLVRKEDDYGHYQWQLIRDDIGLIGVYHTILTYQKGVKNPYPAEITQLPDGSYTLKGTRGKGYHTLLYIPEDSLDEVRKVIEAYLSFWRIPDRTLTQ